MKSVCCRANVDVRVERSSPEHDSWGRCVGHVCQECGRECRTEQAFQLQTRELSHRCRWWALILFYPFDVPVRDIPNLEVSDLPLRANEQTDI